MNTTARRWCAGLPAVTAELHCGGQPHRILWRRGRIVLADHDLVAERSLMALGSEPPVCVEVLQAWRMLRGPALLHGFLDSGGTVPVEELAARRMRHAEAILHATRLMSGAALVLRGLSTNAQQQIEAEKRMWAIALLEALPAEFRRRLVLAMIVEIDRRWHDEAFRDEHREHIEPVLGATAGRLVERSARSWGDDLKPSARLVIESHVLAPGEPPGCTVRFDATGGAGILSLPLAWFTDVWSRGFAFVDECFVTRRAGPAADPATVPVVALRWERAGRSGAKAVEAPAVVTRGDDETWSLRWL